MPPTAPTQGAAPAASPRRDNNIGTLRLVGALLVLYSHSYTLATPGTRDPITENLAAYLPFERGLPGQGVAMFFVLSGFLVAQSFQRRGNLWSYAEARLLRIYPALWVVLGLTIAGGLIVTTLSPADYVFNRQTAGYALLNGSLVDLRYLLPGVFESNPVEEANISLWTLPIEMGMYIAIAVLGVLGMLKRPMVFTAVVAAAFAAFMIDGKSLPIVDSPHDSELILFFLAGSVLYVNRERIPMYFAVAVALIGLGALLEDTRAGAPFIAFGFAYAVMWLALHPRLRLPDLSARGDLSYGTYLYACPVGQFLIVAFGVPEPEVLALLTLAVTLPLAWLSWHLVEEPSLRLKGRLSGLRDRRRALAQTA